MVLSSVLRCTEMLEIGSPSRELTLQHRVAWVPWPEASLSNLSVSLLPWPPALQGHQLSTSLPLRLVMEPPIPRPGAL